MKCRTYQLLPPHTAHKSDHLCPTNIEEVIGDLLNFVVEAMKTQSALQSFIDRRQIEETYLAAKETGADVKHVIAFLDLQSQSYTEDQQTEKVSDRFTSGAFRVQ